jgi:hypothetical protein
MGSGSGGITGSGAGSGVYVYDHSRAGYVYSRRNSKAGDGLGHPHGGTSLLPPDVPQGSGGGDIFESKSLSHSSQQQSSSGSGNGNSNSNTSTSSSGEDTGGPSWRKAFVVVERSSIPKDKKLREKEHSRWKQRVDKYMLEVLGLAPSALAAEKHVPVVCISEIPFKVIRDLVNMVADCIHDHKQGIGSGASQGLHSKKQKNTISPLMAFVAEQQQVSYRRGLKALLIELCETNSVLSANSSGGGGSGGSGSGSGGSSEHNVNSNSSPEHSLQYVLLYSTAEDRYQMLAYIPSALQKQIN